jgi:hypothetical protein
MPKADQERADQWIITLHCDCPIAVMEGDLASDPTEALMEIYDGNVRQVENAKFRGVTARLIPFATYTSDYYRRMTMPCGHPAKS